ncbi:carboxylesterase family protein [Nocardia sp. NPDC101769]|uniref:carboxylesterase family protein n=1 Tax=Nocardia sp. NPDC101769 TaxID=3364333 RepID=UPI003802BD6B
MASVFEGHAVSREDRVEACAGAGGVRGRWDGAVAVSRGIPYAEAPIGPRHFGTPVPVRAWDGVRDALEFGPCVPQPGHTGAVVAFVRTVGPRE